MRPATPHMLVFAGLGLHSAQRILDSCDTLSSSGTVVEVHAFIRPPSKDSLLADMRCIDHCSKNGRRIGAYKPMLIQAPTPGRIAEQLTA